MKPRLMIFLSIALLAGNAEAAGDKTGLLRDVTGRVGPLLGSASACQSIAQSRIQAITDKFTVVIRDTAPSDAERNELNQMFDRTVADGRSAVASGRVECKAVDRQLADLEKSIAGPSLPPAIGPSSVAATAPTAPIVPVAPVAAAPTQRGVTDREIRFGIAAAFSGSNKETGRQMKLGIETAFNRINDTGGVDGRMLRLTAVDDGNEPGRTGEAMKQLYEKEQVFGVIGNTGTPTAAVAVPYVLERRMLFFGAFTGANVVRHDPPDRYVFNYRPSYAEEADAAVRYLMKMRRISPKQIAVFGQQDAYGDAAFAGVAKAFRALGLNDGDILRLYYQRNTVDVDDAVNQLKAQRVPIKAVVMATVYRAGARFIEKTRDLFPGMIYTSVSGVGGSALANELALLGPRYASGVIVTQVVPAVSGYSSAVLEFKNALGKYFPGEAPDYVALEGFVAANVLAQGIKRAGPQFDTEKLVDALESMRDLDLGLGTTLNFGRAEHQASHKIWGTAIDETGKFQAIELE